MAIPVARYTLPMSLLVGLVMVYWSRIHIYHPKRHCIPGGSGGLSKKVNDPHKPYTNLNYPYDELTY